MLRATEIVTAFQARVGRSKKTSVFILKKKPGIKKNARELLLKPICIAEKFCTPEPCSTAGAGRGSQNHTLSGV